MLSQSPPSQIESEFASSRSGFDYSGRPTLDRMLLAKGQTSNCHRDRTIYREGEPCTKLYKVVEGAVRVCKFREDGCRQIEAFYLPGDYFGFGIEEEARFTAEATIHSTLWSADVGSALTKKPNDEGVTGAMWRLAVSELHRSQNHALLLSYRHAQDRILAFLEEMAKRLTRSPLIDLPMSRQDIADYLGLTIETVSRSLTDLARQGTIKMPRPRSVILKRGLQVNAPGAFGGKPSYYKPYSSTELRN